MPFFFARIDVKVVKYKFMTDNGKNLEVIKRRIGKNGEIFVILFFLQFILFFLRY